MWGRICAKHVENAVPNPTIRVFSANIWVEPFGGWGEAPKHINSSTTSPHPSTLTQTATHRFRILGKILYNRSLMSDRSPRTGFPWLTYIHVCIVVCYLIVNKNSSGIDGSPALLFFSHRKPTSIVQKLGSHRKAAHIVQKLGGHRKPTPVVQKLGSHCKPTSTVLCRN